MKRREAVLWALVLGLCVYEFGNSTAWAQFKSQLGGVASVTTASGLSGSGLDGDPLACTAASASAAGCVSTAAQTFAGNKTVLGAAGQAANTALFTVGNPDGGTALATVDLEGDLAVAGGATFAGTDTDARFRIVTTNDTTPVTITNWDTRHFTLGKAGAGTGGFGVSYNQTSGLVYLLALEPAVAWRTFEFRAAAHNWYIGSGNTLGMSLSASNLLTLSASTGDALSVVAGGYARIKTVAGAPTATDCDAAGEAGRLVIDTTTPKWCVCDGASWKCVAVAP